MNQENAIVVFNEHTIRRVFIVDDASKRVAKKVGMKLMRQTNFKNVLVDVFCLKKKRRAHLNKLHYHPINLAIPHFFKFTPIFRN